MERAAFRARRRSQTATHPRRFEPCRHAWALRTSTLHASHNAALAETARSTASSLAAAAAPPGSNVRWRPVRAVKEVDRCWRVGVVTHSEAPIPGQMLPDQADRCLPAFGTDEEHAQALRRPNNWTGGGRSPEFGCKCLWRWPGRRVSVSLTKRTARLHCLCPRQVVGAFRPCEQPHSQDPCEREDQDAHPPTHRSGSSTRSRISRARVDSGAIPDTTSATRAADRGHRSEILRTAAGLASAGLRR